MHPSALVRVSCLTTILESRSSECESTYRNRRGCRRKSYYNNDTPLEIVEDFACEAKKPRESFEDVEFFIFHVFFLFLFFFHFPFCFSVFHVFCFFFFLILFMFPMLFFSMCLFLFSFLLFCLSRPFFLLMFFFSFFLQSSEQTPKPETNRRKNPVVKMKIFPCENQCLGLGGQGGGEQGMGPFEGDSAFMFFHVSFFMFAMFFFSFLKKSVSSFFFFLFFFQRYFIASISIRI